MSEYNSTVALDCIATDPGSTTIYGISKVMHENVMSVMLVKSIANPSHISGNMWTIVSETVDAPLSYWGEEDNIRPFKFVDCAVSSKGAFSAFFRNGQYLTPGSVTVPIGVRYDPESQTWSSIKTSPNYGWTSDLWVHKSFYVNKDGVESVVHALTDVRGTVIRFGVVNEAKNVLQLAGVWKKDRAGQYIPGDQSDSMQWMHFREMDIIGDRGLFILRFRPDDQRMMYANGHLYIVNINSQTLSETIDSYPFTDATAPPPPKDQVFKGPNKFVSDYLFSGTRNGSTYLGGISMFRGDKEYNTYTISNLNGVMQPGPIYAAPFYDYSITYFREESSKSPLGKHAVHDNFVGVGGHLDGQDPFVLGLTSEGVYEFAINSKNISNPIGVTDVVITTPNTYRSYNPIIMGSYHLRKGRSYSSSKIKAWQAIIVLFGSIIGVMIIVTIIKGRRRRARADREGNHENRNALDARGRRITQEFSMGTLTHRTGHASGADGRSRRARIGAVATPTRLHPSITNADIVAYENAILNNADFTSDPPPEFVSSPDEESGDSHPAATAAADLLPPPSYADDGRVPEYSRHPQQPEVIIPISRA